jgi:hypothetical protein
MMKSFVKKQVKIAEEMQQAQKSKKAKQKAKKQAKAEDVKQRKRKANTQESLPKPPTKKTK